MTKIKTKDMNVDGSSIVKSITTVIDSIKYRKYAKKDYTTVLYIDKENTTIKILDGKFDDLGSIKIKGINDTKLIDKVYILPTKKLVTNCVIIKEDINTTIDINIKDIIKEDINTTIDINIKDTSKLTPKLLNKFTETKLMSELASFDVGQVLMGAAIGIVVGGMGMFTMILVYNSFL